MVVIASGSLELIADINVTGKGFRGGTPVTAVTGKCFATNPIPFNTYNILAIHSDSTSGKKGEGAISNSFGFIFGKGPLEIAEEQVWGCIQVVVAVVITVLGETAQKKAVLEKTTGIGVETEDVSMANTSVIF
ncbi:MAG: hypothetical protein HC905_04735 [Bacteroidales bacterium]|nr:hypothetical protein [Bacteroidales bacterium]